LTSARTANVKATIVRTQNLIENLEIMERSAAKQREHVNAELGPTCYFSTSRRCDGATYLPSGMPGLT